MNTPLDILPYRCVLDPQGLSPNDKSPGHTSQVKLEYNNTNGSSGRTYMSTLVVLYVFLACVAIWYYFSTYSRQRGKSIPGPRGLPVIGKGFELFAENVHLKRSQYAEKYGEIVQAEALNKTFVSLKTSELVRSAFNDDLYKRYMNDRFEGYWGKNVLYNSESIGFYPHITDGVQSAIRKGYTRRRYVYGDGIKDFEDRVGQELRRLEKTIYLKGGKDFEFVGVIKRSLSNLLSNFE